MAQCRSIVSSSSPVTYCDYRWYIFWPIVIDRTNDGRFESVWLLWSMVVLSLNNDEKCLLLLHIKVTIKMSDHGYFALFLRQQCYSISFVKAWIILNSRQFYLLKHKLHAAILFVKSRKLHGVLLYRQRQLSHHCQWVWKRILHNSETFQQSSSWSLIFNLIWIIKLYEPLKIFVFFFLYLHVQKSLPNDFLIIDQPRPPNISYGDNPLKTLVGRNLCPKQFAPIFSFSFLCVQAYTIFCVVDFFFLVIKWHRTLQSCPVQGRRACFTNKHILCGSFF